MKASIHRQGFVTILAASAAAAIWVAPADPAAQTELDKFWLRARKVDVLPQILSYLKGKGFQLVTVDELMTAK